MKKKLIILQILVLCLLVNESFGSIILPIRAPTGKRSVDDSLQMSQMGVSNDDGMNKRFAVNLGTAKSAGWIQGRKKRLVAIGGSPFQWGFDQIILD
ncbi:unnamed protein product [Brachionus calyciflorus]|uniref:Uncharacterized protein n=1 Tax=Brachionus calyciflorus TaxID=104777 RepID=A0A813PJH4_9BILA|nr:unnamed protein product [Brachionus calyciflorus]